MAHALGRRGVPALVLDAGERPGDAWRERYDSLVLFTPSQYSALPGKPFPLPDDRYPTKDEMADYLEAYAREMAIALRHGCRVTRLAASRATPGYAVETEAGATLSARRVVVATGALQRPAVPAFAADLDPEVVQLHTSRYRNPGDLPDGRVVVVGAGNSGAQIAEELAAVREVEIAFDRLPKRFPQRFLGRDVFWWFLAAGVMDRTREGDRHARDVVGAIPLIGSRLPALLRRGALRRRPRVVGAAGRKLRFADGESVEAAAVVWATGFRNDFGWIDVPGALDADGHPIHRRGVGQPAGLHFLGLPGLHTKGSAFVGFVGRDAEYLADVLAGPRGGAR